MDKCPKCGGPIECLASRSTPPENDIGATHWAATPDGEILLYQIRNNVLLWFPFSAAWDSPGTVPYTLYCFDDYED